MNKTYFDLVKEQFGQVGTYACGILWTRSLWSFLNVDTTLPREPDWAVLSFSIVFAGAFLRLLMQKYAQKPLIDVSNFNDKPY